MHSHSKKMRFCGFLVENVEAVGKNAPLWEKRATKNGFDAPHQTRFLFIR